MKKCIWRTALVGLTITAAAVSAQQQQEQIEPVSRPPGWSMPSAAMAIHESS